MIYCRGKLKKKDAEENEEQVKEEETGWKKMEARSLDQPIRGVSSYIELFL